MESVLMILRNPAQVPNKILITAITNYICSKEPLFLFQGIAYWHYLCYHKAAKRYFFAKKQQVPSVINRSSACLAIQALSISLTFKKRWKDEIYFCYCFVVAVVAALFLKLVRYHLLVQ